MIAAVRFAVRRRRSFSFAGKVVLITGGSRGLGLLLAREFAAEGARLVICARDPEELERARADLAARGAEVLVVRADLRDKEQVREVVRQAEGRFGGVDVLVNNASIIQVGPVDTMTHEDYEDSAGVHIWGPLDLMLAVLPGMRARGGGRIVNISSIGGEISVPHLLPYSAGKFALSGLSEGLRAELLKDRIYVTTVIPGLMRTGSPVNALFKGRHQEEYRWFSLSAALPVLSLSAERAARRIVAATRAGQPALILGLPAKVAVRAHGLFPGITADLLGYINRLLPAAGGIGAESATGAESETPLTRSWVTLLSRRAGARTNEAPTTVELQEALRPPAPGG